MKVKRRCDLWGAEPMSISLVAGLRCMQTDMHLIVSAYVTSSEKINYI